MHTDYFAAAGGRRGLVSSIMSWTNDAECYQLMPVDVNAIDNLSGITYNFGYENHGFATAWWQTMPAPQQSIVPVNCIKP